MKVHVIAQSPLDADLTMRYQVPDARWAPLYDARLQTGSKTEPPKLSLARRAAITQRSGENWDNVALALSTARPSDGSSAPAIETQSVDYEQQPSARCHGRAERRSGCSKRKMSAEPAQEAPTAKRRQASPETRRHRLRKRSLNSRARRSKRHSMFRARTTVAGTGEVKRVLLTSEDTRAGLEQPFRAQARHQSLSLCQDKVAKGTPLLPGQVSLFRDGTFVGTGDLPLLQPGEEHELGFGVDDQVKVRHAVLEEKRGETGLISTSHVDSRNFRVSVKNMHERPIDVTILDQYPGLAERRNQGRAGRAASPTTQNVDDKRGVIAFAATLEPDEERMIEYGYRISWPASKSIVYGP